jgi:hypothetical protein
MAKNIQVDVQISGGMGFYKFNSLTRKARAWVKKNVNLESWQMIGDSAFGCEGRYAQDLANGMQEAGLIVR